MLVFSVFAGAVFPLFGILKLGPMLGGLPASWSSVELGAAQLSIAAGYVVAGMVMGCFCEGKNLPWIYLVTSLPATS